MEPIIIKDAFEPQREVSFFLRIHGHLPDDICGSYAMSDCKYRKDGEPINCKNERVIELRENPDFVKKEKEVEKAVKNGKVLMIKPRVKKGMTDEEIKKLLN